MESEQNKENINNNNYQKYIFSKKDRMPINYLTLNAFIKANEMKARKIEQPNINNYNNNNNYNNYNEAEEDLDIELNSISKIIPINTFINIDQQNNIQKENIFIDKKPKIKRSLSVNSFFDNMQFDNNQNIITDNNNYKYNNDTNTNNYTNHYPNCSDFNMTNFGLTNRPEIQSKHLIEKDVIHTIANNTNNINNAFNDTFNDNKDFYPIKRHNSVINSNT